MEKGRDEDNAEAREEERLARIRERNNEDFERFGRFRFSNINEENGGPASQRQTKRKKVIYHAFVWLLHLLLQFYISCFVMCRAP